MVDISSSLPRGPLLSCYNTPRPPDTKSTTHGERNEFEVANNPGIIEANGVAHFVDLHKSPKNPALVSSDMWLQFARRAANAIFAIANS